MSAMQKFAWFNLAVIALTLAIVFSLLPLLGQRAAGGFGFLGLLGFGVLFLRKKPGQVLTDERDHLIQRRSARLAFSLFFTVFVLAVVLCPAIYGSDGAVPVKIIQNTAWYGFMLIYAVTSLAILVQYGRGAKDGE